MPETTDERLFDLDEVPEVPLFREPPPGRGALVMDERITHDYPPEWNRCTTCDGRGDIEAAPVADLLPPGEGKLSIAAKYRVLCPDCLGMGSVKAMVRLLARHRCERCGHPYMPKGDAKMLGVDPSPYHWSPCDDLCTHTGPVRVWLPELDTWVTPAAETGPHYAKQHYANHKIEAEWRILTVHHLSGDKADCRWGNLAALCQRCHLTIQGNVVLERVYPFEHSPWFKPHAAWWYALNYLGEDLSREQVMERLDELLALERVV